MPRPAAPPRPASRGFTFLELLIVMGTMAVILGLGIGFLTRVGTANRVYQSAAIVAEAGFECQNRSAGGKTATLILTREKNEDEVEQIVVTQSIQRPVLTESFEDAEFSFTAAAPDVPKTSGSVRLDENGASGRCAVLSKNGMIDFGTQAIFAPTDGIDVDVWVKPASGRGTMTVIRGEEAYEVLLSKDAAATGNQDSYKVILKVFIIPADVSRRADVTGSWRSFETAGSPVHAGAWSRLSVSYNGREAVLKVDGVDRTQPAERREKDAPEPPLYHIVVPSSGGARLSVSSERWSFEGSVDDLLVSGIFRNDEDRRVLRGNVDILEVHGATRSNRFPMRVVWWNGRLDPKVHSMDETFEISADTEEGHYAVTFGLYGLITPATKVTGGRPAPAAPQTTPTNPNK